MRIVVTNFTNPKKDTRQTLNENQKKTTELIGRAFKEMLLKQSSKS